MSVLDGLAGVGLGLAGAGQAIAAQKRADQLERELTIREAQERRAAVQERERLDTDAANTNVRMFKNAGILNDGLDRIDRNRAVAKLEANDPVARQALLNAARTSGFIDASVKDIRFVKGPNDEWVIQTSNDDGTFGVITADGSKDPNAPVASFKSLDDFIGVANVAYNRSVVRQNEFDIAKQNTVTNALNEQFDILEQQLEEQGVPPEQQVAIKRGVAAGVANIEDPQEQAAFVEAVIQGDQPPPAEAPAPETTTSPEELPRGRQELIEYRKTPEYQAKAKAASAERTLERKKNDLKKAEARVEDLEKSGRNARALRAARGTVSILKNEIAELEPETFTMDTPEDQEAMNQVAEQTEGLPVSEVAAKVASGEVTVTPAQQQQVAVSLQQAGVETVSDLRKLKSDRQRALAVASMISAFKGDEATQRALLGQISNVLETGTTSMSAADAATLGLQRDTLNQRIAEYELDVDKFIRTLRTDFAAGQKAAGEFGAQLQKDLAAVKENGVLTEQGVQQFLPSLAPFLTMASALTPEQRPVMMRALAPVFSEILATYAAREEGGVAETLKSIFRGDADPSNISKTDFDLSRVEGKFTPDGKFEGFYYTSEPQRNKDGTIERRRKDELVLANDIRQLDKTIYEVLVLAALANAKDQPLSLQEVEDVAVPRVR